MSLFVTSLNSGSNGNCYYVGNDTEAVLIDAGISCKEVEKRMLRCGLSMSKVKGIFISHEHSDHISGVQVLSKKYRLPVYITNATYNNSRLSIDQDLVYDFKADVPVKIGNLSINPFRKFHDAADPHSFTVEGNGVCVGVFTDIGRPCKNVVYHFKKCAAVILEANFDEEMLAAGSYPYHLKKRITSGHGHLSNAEALNLFTTHRSDHLTHLVLSHLSKNNNCPKLVDELFNHCAGNTNITVASRYEETAVLHVTVSKDLSTSIKTRKICNTQLQLSLF